MTIERIDLNPESSFSFSSCVVAGDTIYTAHHAGFDKEEESRPHQDSCYGNGQ
jgi:hypothetical protein